MYLHMQPQLKEKTQPLQWLTNPFYRCSCNPLRPDLVTSSLPDRDDDDDDDDGDEGLPHGAFPRSRSGYVDGGEFVTHGSC